MIEVKDMPRKITAKRWVEPTRQGPPTWELKDAQEYLHYDTVESVRLLTKYGPYKDGLQGYIQIRKKGQLGKVWVKREESGLTGRQLGGTPIYVYEEDVIDWYKRHPMKEPLTWNYTNQEKYEVLTAIDRYHLRNEDGSVTRARLMAKLYEEYKPRYGNHDYGKVSQILNDANIPKRGGGGTNRRFRAIS